MYGRKWATNGYGGFRRRSCITSIVLAATVTLYLVAVDRPASAADNGELSAEAPRKVKPDDWAALMDEHGNPLEITKLKVVMYKREAAKWLSHLSRTERCEVETTNQLFLDVMPDYLRMPLREACPEHEDYEFAQTPSNDCLGELRVTTVDGPVVFGITPRGFTLQARRATWENTFRSWGVATVIDRILREHGKQGLPERLLLDLSPQSDIEREKLALKVREERLRPRKTESRQPSEAKGIAADQSIENGVFELHRPPHARKKGLLRFGPAVELAGQWQPDKRVPIIAVSRIGSGRQFAVVTKGGDVLVYDAMTLKVFQRFSYFQPPSKAKPCRDGVYQACFSADGTRLCMHTGWHVAVWDVASGKLLVQKYFTRIEVACGLAVSDGGLVALAGFRTRCFTTHRSELGLVELWDTTTGDVGTIMPERASRCTPVAFQPNGAMLAVVSDVDSVTPEEHNSHRYSLWNTETLKLSCEFPYDSAFGELDPIRFDRQGRYLIGSFLRDGASLTRCWDVKDNKPIWDIQTAKVLSLTREPLGMLVREGTSELRHVAPAVRLDRFLVTLGDEEFVEAAQFNDDGTLLVVGTRKGDVYLFRVGKPQKSEKR